MARFHTVAMKLNNFVAASKMKRVFLVDPFAIVRSSVAQWLENTADLSLCGQADNSSAALKAIRRLKPDIVVTEIIGRRDIEFIETLRRRHPRLPILVFSSGDEILFAPLALMAGANGYLVKGSSTDGLIDGIRRTLEGRMILSENMRYELLAKCTRQRRTKVPSTYGNRGDSYRQFASERLAGPRVLDVEWDEAFPK